MSEFKFICPQCKQHIECDASYVGTPINCPACRQSIMVPPMPPAVAAPVERTIQLKVSTLRKVAFIGLGTLLAAGIIAAILFVMGNQTGKVWAEWSALDGDGDVWSFAHGKIHAHCVNGDAVLASEQTYGDVTLSARVSTTNREASLMVRLQDAGNGYLILFAPPRTPCPWNKSGFVSVIKKVGGNEITLASYNKRNLFAIGQTAKLKVIAHGPVIEVQLNGTKILRVNDSTYVSGHIGLRIYGTPDYPCDSTFSRIAFN